MVKQVSLMTFQAPIYIKAILILIFLRNQVSQSFPVEFSSHFAEHFLCFLFRYIIHRSLGNFDEWGPWAHCQHFTLSKEPLTSSISLYLQYLTKQNFHFFIIELVAINRAK